MQPGLARNRKDTSFRLNPGKDLSVAQRTPSRVGAKSGRLHAPLVVAGQVDGIEAGSSACPLGLAEEQNHPAVGRPSRSLVVVALGEDALAGAVRAHDANEEAAAH